MWSGGGGGSGGGVPFSVGTLRRLRGACGWRGAGSCRPRCQQRGWAIPPSSPSPPPSHSGGHPPLGRRGVCDDAQPQPQDPAAAAGGGGRGVSAAAAPPPGSVRVPAAQPGPRLVCTARFATRSHFGSVSRELVGVEQLLPLPPHALTSPWYTEALVVSAAGWCMECRPCAAGLPFCSIFPSAPFSFPRSVSVFTLCSQQRVT